MSPIVAHVVTTEGQHGHRIAPHHPDRASGRRSRFGRQSRSQEGPMLPIEGLIDERNHLLPTRAEKYRANGHALGLFPFGRIARTLLNGYCKAGIRVRRGLTPFRIPWLTAPIEGVVRHRVIMSLPPHRTVRPQRDVGE